MLRDAAKPGAHPYLAAKHMRAPDSVMRLLGLGNCSYTGILDFFGVDDNGVYDGAPWEEVAERVVNCANFTAPSR